MLLFDRSKRWRLRVGGSLLFGLSPACSILSWLGRGSQASSASAGHPGQPAAQSRALRLLHWSVPVFPRLSPWECVHCSRQRSREEVSLPALPRNFLVWVGIKPQSVVLSQEAFQKTSFALVVFQVSCAFCCTSGAVKGACSASPRQERQRSLTQV